MKIFNTSEEASWYRESQLYQSVTLRHDNVLGFIASDVKGSGAFTQLFLITEYHPFGSLLRYLRCCAPLSPRRLLRMAHSLSTGVNYLHTEIAGSRGKPAVVHRDLKSSNVLVKSDHTLCVADLGLALCQSDSGTSLPPLPPLPHQRAGTRRYMAPELLERELAATAGLPCEPLSFEACKKADIYALGLVVWELCRRAQWLGPTAAVPEHELPYAEHFGASPDETPSLEQMARLVCTEERRPSPPSVDANASGSALLLEVVRLLRECWCANPDARLPALRVKKVLVGLLDRHAPKAAAAAAPGVDAAVLDSPSTNV